MRRRKFLVLSMGMVTDTDSPQVLTPEIQVVKNEKNDNGETVTVHMPVSVQNFSNREAFVTEMTAKALRMWDMLDEVIQDNEEIEQAEKVVLEHAPAAGELN